MTKPIVGILMGSDSDYNVMENAVNVLREFEVPFEVKVTSAHRTPARTLEYTRGARERGLQVLIVGAGAAAHLAGVVAAETTLPVIGVPIDSSPLKGVDALYATVMMPGGIPVATMAIGKAGAKNAALFAIAILAAFEPDRARQLADYRTKMAATVEEKDLALQARIKS